MNSTTLVTRFLRDDIDTDILVLDPPVHEDSVLEFAHAVADGLGQAPRRLQCRYLYDARGSELFEKICSTPEYYPTRTEAAILRRYAAEIARITGPLNLVELGSGTSIKTRHVLEAYLGATADVRYVPIDVSRSALEAAHRSITRQLPDVEMKPINTTYESAFDLVHTLSPAMLLFLGSTIGNFSEEQFAAFWAQVQASLQPRDFFLLGVDLVKDVETLEAAYNDAAGHTAEFTCNMFARMNRELGANIDMAAIKHVAEYNAHQDQIETYARFTAAQEIHVGPLDTTFRVEADEAIRVEISRKFRLDRLLPRLEAFGMRARQVFTDERDWFALILLQRAE